MRARDDGEQRCQRKINGVAGDLDDLAHFLPKRRDRRGCGCAFWHGQENQRGNGERKDRKPKEHGAPTCSLDRQLQRRRGDDEAERTDRHHQRIGERPSLLGHPDDDGLEGAHQAAAEAKPDDGARNEQRRDGMPHAEEQRAGAADCHQGRLHAPGTIAIEQNTQRQLEGREGEEIGSRHQAELGSVQPDVPDEVRSNHGVGCSIEVGEKVAEAEG